MAHLIPAAPGWYVTEIVATTEDGDVPQRYSQRPVIAWHVVDLDAGALLPIVPNLRPGVVQATVRLDMGRDGRRLTYRPGRVPASALVVP